MGLFSSNNAKEAPPPLPPAPYAIGVFPQFSNHHSQIVLKLLESKKMLKGDDFKIEDAASGEDILQCHGKHLRYGVNSKILDTHGQHLYTLKKKRAFCSRTYIGINESEQVLFSVKVRRFTIGSQFTITFNNTANKGELVELAVKGSAYNRKALITHQEVPIGRISRDFWNKRDLIRGRQTYYLTCAPGVDAALLTGIALALDSHVEQKKRQRRNAAIGSAVSNGAIGGAGG